MTTPRLVAVYRSRHDADQVAAALHRLGVRAEEMDVGSAHDQTAAAVAEQRAEVASAWSVAPSALITEEQAKGATTAIPVGVTIGAVLGLGLGLALPDTMVLWGRLLLGAGIGGLFGGVVTMVIGAGLGARGPAVPGAAQGTPLSVHRTDRAVRDVLASADYLRIDLVDGTETTVVATEGPDESGRERLEHRLQRDPHGDWSTVGPDQPRADDRAEGDAPA